MSRTHDLSQRIRSINARITTVGRLYGKDSGIYKRIISTIQKAGGNTRFKKSMFSGSLRDLAKATNALEAVEHNPYTTKAGRKDMGKRAREAFALSHDTYSDIAITKMYDVFKNSSFARFDEVYKGYSEVFLDAIMTAFEDEENAPSVKQMVKKIDYFTSHLNEFNASNAESAVEEFKKWLST